MNPFPDVVRIEPYGGNCNFRCRHCPTGMQGGKRGMLSFDNFKILFDRLPIIPRVLVMYHGSEPLVNKELPLMLRYAKEKGVKKTLLNTNAALIKGVIPDLDEMRVSFDGESPEENNFIRRNGNFAKQAPKVLEVAKAGQNVVIYNAKATGGLRSEPAKYLTDFFGGAVRYRTEAMRLWSSQDTALEGHEFVEMPTRATYCSDLFTTFTIMSDGNVPKCCEDLPGEYTYGNACTEMPLDIWERMQTIRDRFSKGDYPDVCASCWVVAGRYVK